jgi:predicted DNA-binding ribbon-helix-helix protein
VIELDDRLAATAEDKPAGKDNILKQNNVCVEGKKRTSVKLEEIFWKGLTEVAAREGCSKDDICRKAWAQRENGSSHTSAIRVYIFKALTGIR